MPKPVTLPDAALANMSSKAKENLPGHISNPDDVIHTGSLTGPQVFDGGDGNDTLVVDSTTMGPDLYGYDLNISLDLALRDQPYGITGSQLDGSSILNIENLTVNTTLSSRISGSDLANRIEVTANGSDLTIDGFGGDDYIIARNASGGSNAFPGAGNDTVVAISTGGAGYLVAEGDWYGGSGNDVFDFSNVSGVGVVDYLGQSIGDDRVVGFTAGQDRIHLNLWSNGYTYSVAEVNGSTVISLFNGATPAGSVTIDAVGLALDVDYFA